MVGYRENDDFIAPYLKHDIVREPLEDEAFRTALTRRTGHGRHRWEVPSNPRALSRAL